MNMPRHDDQYSLGFTDISSVSFSFSGGSRYEVLAVRSAGLFEVELVI